MEVRHHQIDRFEPVAGRDEDIRVAAIGTDASVVVRRRLQQAHRGRADGDNPPAGISGLIDEVGGAFADFAPFGMHHVMAGIFLAVR